jgi:hypothetical protein
MKLQQLILLGVCVAIGVIWVFVLQNWLFLNIFPGLLVGPGLKLDDYLQTGSSPAFTVLWIGCIAALLIWFGTTLVSRPRSSASVRTKQPLWWLAACLLSVFGWLCLSWFTVFRWQVSGTSPIDGGLMNFYPVPPGGWLLLMLFVLFDVVILFWLPTLVASPRTYRFVVPGAVSLLGSR